MIKVYFGDKSQLEDLSLHGKIVECMKFENKIDIVTFILQIVIFSPTMI